MAQRCIGVFDGHNDLVWERRQRHDYSFDGLGEETPDTFQTDIPKLRRGGVSAQFWSVFVNTDLRGGDAVTATLEQIDGVHRLIARFPDDLRFARTADDVRAAWAQGRIASLMGAEGGHQIDDSPAVLRMYALLGVRYLTLTWNEHTSWADCAILPPEHGGLTDFGREVIAEMNRIGMIVDLSHVSAETMSDALDASHRPVMFSHSSCRALGRHPRDIPDDVLSRLSANGGVAMMTFVAPFLSEEYHRWVESGKVGAEPVVGVTDVADHVEHAREVAGIEHIGLGGDYDGSDYMPQGMADVSGYPALFDELRRRGWSEDDLDRLGHGNVLRVLEANDVAYRRFLASQE